MSDLFVLLRHSWCVSKWSIWHIFASIRGHCLDWAGYWADTSAITRKLNSQDMALGSNDTKAIYPVHSHNLIFHMSIFFQAIIRRLRMAGWRHMSAEYGVWYNRNVFVFHGAKTNACAYSLLRSERKWNCISYIGRINQHDKVSSAYPGLARKWLKIVYWPLEMNMN